ncbi:MAG TPA: extracellular solute-binding protein, partial [Clostridia bacterium]|nr:extracellular solute-binding protein [Clostridia bacterium]
MKGRFLDKTVSIVIAAAIMVVGLAGCNKTTTPTETEQTTAAPGEKTARPIVNGYPDLGGMVVRVLHDPGVLGRNNASYSSVENESDKMKQRINEIRQNYNCEIEYVDKGDKSRGWRVLQTSILTNQPCADIAFVDNWVITDSVEKGGLYQVLTDFDDILELDNAELWNQELMHKFFTIDGMVFGAEAPQYGIELGYQGAVCFFNKSMLEREGLWDEYDLYEMQRNKTWTWDALDEVATKVTKDKTGDGTIDQFGMIYIWTITHFAFNASNCGESTGWGWYEVNDAGQPVFRGRERERLNVLYYFQQMGAKGKGWLRAPNYEQDFIMGPLNDFTRGSAAFYISNGHVIELIKQNKMEDTLGVVAV